MEWIYKTFYINNVYVNEKTSQYFSGVILYRIQNHLTILLTKPYILNSKIYSKNNKNEHTLINIMVVLLYFVISNENFNVCYAKIVCFVREGLTANLIVYVIRLLQSLFAKCSAIDYNLACNCLSLWIYSPIMQFYGVIIYTARIKCSIRSIGIR